MISIPATLAFFIGFDPLYLALIIPTMLLAGWAQMKVKSTYAAASKIPAMSRLSGAQAARQLLDLNGLNNITIEQARGFLSDHYDPRHKVLRLSPDVYAGRSLASLGIAAHEAGHAIQDAKNYAPLAIRNGLVPMASIGSNLSITIFTIGMVMAWISQSAGPGIGQTLMIAGIILFSAVVLFQLINLPVEFDASNRAKAALVEYGIVHESEMKPIRSVLSAAALTYVAATLGSVMTLIYLLIRSGLLSGGNRN